MPRERASYLIVFVDLARFKAQSLKVDDAEVADTIDHFYRLVADAVNEAGGRVVKFIGDAALAVFPEDRLDAGVGAVLAMPEKVDQLLSAKNWECRVHARIHYGSVIAGEYAPDGRFDVIGRAVNSCAMLPSGGIAVTPQALQRLSPAMLRVVESYRPRVTIVEPRTS